MNCKNCDTTLMDDFNYCSSCGAKTIRNRLTIKTLLNDFGEQYLNLDNKFLKTFFALFTKSEIVIGGYINGTRKKYVNAISYFTIAITFSGLYLFVLNRFFPDTMAMPNYMPESQKEFQNNTMSIVQEYQSIIAMLLIPVYALMSKLVFIGLKKYNFTELLVVFMYTQSQISIVMAILIIIGASLGINFYMMSFISIPIMILYTSYCLFRLYGLTLKGIILRTLLFLFVLGISYFVFIILILIIMYLSGDLEQIMEAQKAAKNS